MLARDTKIYRDSYLLTKEIFAVTKRIKTEYRSSIARRLEELSIEISMRIVEANLCAPNSEERQKVLGHDFIVSYERFFYLLSLAFDLKLINFKQHATLRIEPICKDSYSKGLSKKLQTLDRASLCRLYYFIIHIEY